MERFANRDCVDMIISQYNDGTPLMYIDYANASSVELTGEAVYAYGGHNHVKRVTFQGNREATLTLETQVQSFKLYQLITGGDIKTTGVTLVQREELTATSTGLELSETPEANTIYVFAYDDDCGTKLDVSSNGKKITGTGLAASKKYIVYYKVKKSTAGDTKVTSISLGAADYGQDVTITGLTYMKTEGGVNVPYRIVAYKAQAQSNATWGFSNDGDPQTLTITFDLMADSKNGDKMLDLIMIEEPKKENKENS